MHSNVTTNLRRLLNAFHPHAPCIHKQLIIINSKWADKLAAPTEITFHSIWQRDDHVLIMEHEKKRKNHVTG